MLSMGAHPLRMVEFILNNIQHTPSWDTPRASDHTKSAMQVASKITPNPFPEVQSRSAGNVLRRVGLNNSKPVWSSEQRQEARKPIPVCEEIVDCLRSALYWSPESHRLFPPRFREVVRFLLVTFKLFERILSKHDSHALAQNIGERILSFLPREHAFTYCWISSYDTAMSMRD